MNSYLLIFLAIIFSAFFSGMEIAFVTSNRLRIELDRKQGAFGSGITRFFTMNPGQYIATMLIGNNISLVVYGLIMANILGPVIYPLVGSDAITLLLQTIISTGIILFVGNSCQRLFFFSIQMFS